MVSVKLVALAGATALLATAASAADMPSLPPMELPVVEEFASGWYLRGDIGMSNQQARKFGQVGWGADPEPTSVTSLSSGFDSAPLFGIGIGYQWNTWLRFDVTGEYRGKANFRGMDQVVSGGTFHVDQPHVSKSEWVAMANIYADLGTWWCLTPFVGAGIGFSYNTLSNFQDTNVFDQAANYAGPGSKWNFAWALHAGVGYKVNSNLVIELAYRYISLGDAITGSPILGYDGTLRGTNFRIDGITSHDLKVGVRWMLEPAHVPQPLTLPPLMRRG
jgi:opacity protein-like surface antigen